MRASRNTLTVDEVDRMIAGDSSYGFVPFVIAAKAGLKAGGKLVKKATGGHAEEPVAPVVLAPVVQPPPESPVPYLLAAAGGLGIGALAGYWMARHA